MEIGRNVTHGETMGVESIAQAYFGRQKADEGKRNVAWIRYLFGKR